MEWNLLFFINSVLLGVGLSMDAFSISLVNGLNGPGMKTAKMCRIAGVFGGFQAFMPLAGWICVHTIAETFKTFERYIPWIALMALIYIGGKMLAGGIYPDSSRKAKPAIGFSALMMQGIATSIDALSVGFTIAGYRLSMALSCSLIIAAVTFILCMAGLAAGKKCGTHLAGKAEILGGIILIVLGIEIAVTSIV